MSIPLDRLYHYIESVAQDVYGDTIIYHFYPHGSKNIEHLHTLHLYSVLEHNLYPLVFCNDQEPLNFDLYKDYPAQVGNDFSRYIKDKTQMPRQNLRYKIGNVYDQAILLHSEKQSSEVEKYQRNDFIPVYYWSHALIALDWYRFARYYDFSKCSADKTTFLIYNRAWAGTREYRIKFAEELVKNNLTNNCKISFNPIDPELGTPYTEYQYTNPVWKNTIKIEDYIKPTLAVSAASADFDIDDYTMSDIEVVLETLFDDSRIHLTEKVLRPIACQQPFIIAGPCNSLKYLQDYGFKTFDPIIDETYDQVTDPQQRLKCIIQSMKKITNWSQAQRKENLEQLKEICTWNKQHFFSKTFFNTIVTELKQNLKAGLEKIESSNTGTRYINQRKQIFLNPNFSDYWTATRKYLSTTEKIQNQQIILSKARSYFTKNK